MIKALEASNRFDAPHPIDQIAKKASEVVSIGNQTGEGWFLTGEMIELIDEVHQISYVCSHLPAYLTM